MDIPAKISVLLTFCVAGGLTARTKTDVVVMANGDRFTCEIKRLERGVLYASFDYVDGTVSLQWSKVAQVQSSQLFIVHVRDGSIYEGTIRTPETPAQQPVRLKSSNRPRNRHCWHKKRWSSWLRHRSRFGGVFRAISTAA